MQKVLKGQRLSPSRFHREERRKASKESRRSTLSPINSTGSSSPVKEYYARPFTFQNSVKDMQTKNMKAKIKKCNNSPSLSLERKENRIIPSELMQHIQRKKEGLTKQRGSVPVSDRRDVLRSNNLLTNRNFSKQSRNEQN
jgi:hypothetical protein